MAIEFHWQESIRLIFERRITFLKLYEITRVSFFFFFKKELVYYTKKIIERFEKQAKMLKCV